MPISLSLLGRPRVAGTTADLPVKALAMLGYLALSDEPQPRDRILGLLWGESTEEAARKNLRNTLWAVRKEMGENAVVTLGDRLALGPEVEVDARRLLGIESSADPRTLLDLYTGPYLDGVTLTGASEFELWLTAARERLLQSFLSRTIEALDELAQAGAWLDVVMLTRRALDHESLHEGLHRSLMEALANLGERGEAIRRFEVLSLALAVELGVEPSPETVAVRDAIASGQLPRLQASRTGAPKQRSRELTRSHLHPGSPFVGRAAERAVLDGELATAAEGQARVVLITGEMGIGKSRLWGEWSASVPAGCTVLEARCVEATSSLPLAPLVELFADHPSTYEILHSPEVVSPAWLAEVARLLPEIRDNLPSLPMPTALPPEEERRRVFEAFVQVLTVLEARPLVIFIDDVHWADRTTLDWIPYLVHRMRRRPLLLVLSYRPEEASPALVHLAAAWARDGVMRRLPLARLTPEETAQLIRGLHVDAALAHQLQAQSAGNPYVLIELRRNADVAVPVAVPPALADLIESRLDRLGEPARVILQAAAVLEPEFDLALLTHTSGQDEAAVLDALDVLLASDVLIERGRWFAFNHPLISRVVRQGLNTARWGVMNRRAAQTLEAIHADRLGPVAGLIADHYVQAGEAASAAVYADLAAEHALSLAALSEAVEFRRQASSLYATPQRQLALGAALYRAGDFVGAREAYSALLSMAERTGDHDSVVRACLGMGDTYLVTGWADEVVQWAERSLRYLDTEASPEAHAHVRFLLGAGRMRAGGAALEEAERDLEEAVRLAESHGLPQLAVIGRFELANVLAERGNLRLAVGAYRETADRARLAGDPHQQVLALNNLAYHTMLLGEAAEARDHLRAALELAEMYGMRLMLEYLFSTHGEIELAQGRWDEAETWIVRSLSEAQAHNNVAHVAKCHANFGLVAVGRGDLDTALIRLEEAAALAAPLTARFMQTQIDLWLGEVYAARGERAAAVGSLHKAEARLGHGHYGGLARQAAALRSSVAGIE